MDFVVAMDQIVEMDKAGKAEETLPLIREMLAYPYKVPRVFLAGVVYSFSETRVLADDDLIVRAKWEVCQVDQDKPISHSWAEFCREHLGMGASSASMYKRVWEVLVVELGYEPGDLVGVGITSLANVIGAMAEPSFEDVECLIDSLLSGESVVYFIQCEDGPIKIGQAKDPVRRLQALQCASPFALRLLGFSADLEESVVHEKFASLCIRGEWYRPMPELLRFIREECET